METPKQLILEKELLGGEIKNVLLYHNTDRWYFGDLLRHAAWVKALSKRKLRVTVATKKDFLTIFENDPSIQTLLPVDDIHEKDFAKYDLTVIPSSFEPTYYSPQIKRGLYSFNRALQHTQYGFILRTLPKDDVNYFRLAQPKFGQTYLPDGTYYKMHITVAERKNAKKILRKLFGSSRDKVIIVNPTASNTFTRETTIKKEVDNLLEVKDYVGIIKNLIELFPSHRILIAAALKRNDKENFFITEAIRKEFSSARVRSITEIAALEEGVSFRTFASILVSTHVVGILGNGTGTNTHLAATLGVPSMSVERGTDDLVKKTGKTSVLSRWVLFVGEILMYELAHMSLIILTNLMKTLWIFVHLFERIWR